LTTLVTSTQHFNHSVSSGKTFFHVRLTSGLLF